MLQGVQTGNTITIYFGGGKVHTIPADHPNYTKVQQALKEGRAADVERLIHIPSFIEAFSKGQFTVKNGILYYEDEPYPDSVTKKVMSMLDGGHPVEPLKKCLAKVKRNRSPYSRQWLFEFAITNNFAIDEDGDFIAYKGVQNDYKDCHSRTFDNSIGATPSMDWDDVLMDKHIACGRGLHISTLQFANGFGARTMVCKVNPENIVSVPSDGNGEKVRTCGYKVIGEIPRHNNRAQPTPQREVYRKQDFITREFAVSMGTGGDPVIRLINAVDVAHAEDIIKDRFGDDIKFVLFDIENMPGSAVYEVIVDGPDQDKAVTLSVRAWDEESAALIALEKVPFSALREDVTVLPLYASSDDYDHYEDEEEAGEDFDRDGWSTKDSEWTQTEPDAFSTSKSDIIQRVQSDIESQAEVESPASVTTAPIESDIDKLPFKVLRGKLRELGRKIGIPLFREGMDKTDMLVVYRAHEKKEPKE